MTYVVFRCRGCNRLVLGRRGQKTRLCGYCGRRNDLSEREVEAEASTPREARQIIAALKSRGRDRAGKLQVEED